MVAFAWQPPPPWHPEEVPPPPQEDDDGGADVRLDGPEDPRVPRRRPFVVPA